MSKKVLKNNKTFPKANKRHYKTKKMDNKIITQKDDIRNTFKKLMYEI